MKTSRLVGFIAFCAEIVLIGFLGEFRKLSDNWQGAYIIALWIFGYLGTYLFQENDYTYLSDWLIGQMGRAMGGILVALLAAVACGLFWLAYTNLEAPMSFPQFVVFVMFLIVAFACLIVETLEEQRQKTQLRQQQDSEKRQAEYHQSGGGTSSGSYREPSQEELQQQSHAAAGGGASAPAGGHGDCGSDDGGSVADGGCAADGGAAVSDG